MIQRTKTIRHTRTNRNAVVTSTVSLIPNTLLVACNLGPTPTPTPTPTSPDTPTPTAAFTLTCTPTPLDGGRIAFASRRDGNFEIYVMNADGSGVTNLTNEPEHDWAPDWSPR